MANILQARTFCALSYTSHAVLLKHSPGYTRKVIYLCSVVTTFVLLFQQKHEGLVLTQGTCVLSRRKEMAGGKNLRNICEFGSCVTLYTLRLKYKTNRPLIFRKTSDCSEYVCLCVCVYMKPIKHSVVKSKVKSDCVSPPEFLIQRLLQHYWNHTVYLREFIWNCQRGMVRNRTGVHLLEETVTFSQNSTAVWRMPTVRAERDWKNVCRHTGSTFTTPNSVFLMQRLMSHVATLLNSKNFCYTINFVICYCNEYFK